MKLQCDEPLSNFTFKFNLHCYIEVEAALGPIARARIGHDNSGLPGTAAWCLAGVSVQPEAGAEVTFDVPGSALWLEVGPWLRTFQLALL